MIKTDLFKRFILAIITTLVLIILFISKLFSNTNYSISDFLFQQPRTPDSRIVIVEIDNNSLSEFGEFPWDRDVLASAIAYLNSDPDNKPAVIGIDVLFDTKSDNDDYLLEVVAENDNVVLSSYGEFVPTLVEEANGDFYLDDYYVRNFYPPFEQLNEIADSGHVNAMFDSDGVLRHGIWELMLPNGEKVPSFNQVIANKYLEKMENSTVEKPPTDVYGRWYIVQQSVPGSYSNGDSVADLVNESADLASFKDKIVLIGPYEPGLQDDFITPIDKSDKMYGVEYQANSISALLTGETKLEVSSNVQLVLFGIIIFLFSLFLFNKKILSATIIWLSFVILWVGIVFITFTMGYILDVFYLPFSITVVYFITIAMNYYMTILEKRKISSTFQKYVAPEIVKELLKDEEQSFEFGGKIVDVAILFVDIRGFTPLSAKLPPKTVVEIINRYLTICSQCVFNHKGTLDKYIGDCTMAFWGAPLPQEDCALKAVKAAAEMIDEIEKASKDIRNLYGEDIKVGIGINYGSAVVGNIGSPVRMDYTIIGDSVNTAARLESVAPGGEIYVSEEIVNQLNGKILFTKVEKNVKLKGKEDGFPVYKFDRIL